LENVRDLNAVSALSVLAGLFTRNSVTLSAQRTHTLTLSVGPLR